MIRRDFLLYGTVQLRPEARDRLGIVWCVFPGLSPMELVGRNEILPIGAADLNGVDALGPALRGNSTTTTGASAPQTDELRALTDQYSVVFIGQVYTLTNYSKLFGVPYSTVGWSAPYVALSMSRDNATSSCTAEFADAGPVFRTVSSDTGMFTTSANETMLGYARSGTAVTFIKDGVQFGAGKTITAGSINWTNRADPAVLNRGRYSTGEGTDGTAFCVLVANRPWATEEFAEFWADPTAILEPEDTFAAWMATGTPVVDDLMPQACM